MSPDAILDVLVVGCGNIAGGFDEARPDDAPPLTHAGAFRRHGGFRLAACVEPDAERRQAFMSHWGAAQGHADIPSPADGRGAFDVISICSPTALHAAHLEATLALRPRLIFCEKPVTGDVEQTARWVDRCEQEGVLLAVNHTRRWAPDVVELREELAEGAWGVLRSATGRYNKGVLNNGGHLVDLLHFLLGPLELLAADAPSHDFWSDDPTIAASLRTRAGVPVQLSVGHAGDYALFELDLVTSGAVISMEDGGMSWRVRRAGESPHFKGYRSLDAGERRPGRYPEAMLRAVQNLHEALARGTPLASTGRSALQAQRVCAAIRAAATQPSSTVTHDRTRP